MTDRELLLENNEKLKTIQQTLKNKILEIQSGVTYIDIQIPEVIADSGDTASVRFVDNNTFLISGNISGTADLGLWEYKVDAKSFRKICAKGYGFSIFKILEDKVLIGPNSSMNSGLFVYNRQTSEMKQLTYSGYNYKNVFEVNSGKYIVSGTSSGALYLYNPTDDSFVQLASSHSWTSCQQIGENKWALYKSTDLIVYDGTTETIKSIVSSGSNTIEFFVNVAENKWMWQSGGNTSELLGLYIYNALDDSYKQIYDSASWSYRIKMGDKFLLSNQYLGRPGLLEYNHEDDSVIEIETTGCMDIYYQQINDTEYLIRQRSGDAGVSLYNTQDSSYTKIYSEGYWSQFIPLETKCLLTSGIDGTQTGILSYDYATKTAELIYSSVSKWHMCQKLGSVYLIFTNDSSFRGFLSYNPETNEVIRLANKSSFTSLVFFDFDNEGGCYVTKKGFPYAANNSNNFIIHYNPTDNTTKITRYRIALPKED